MGRSLEKTLFLRSVHSSQPPEERWCRIENGCQNWLIGNGCCDSGGAKVTPDIEDAVNQDQVRNFWLNLGNFTSSERIYVATMFSVFFYSYCLISHCWGMNQLHRGVLITEELSILPTSPSPLWSPDKSDAKENGESKIYRINTRVCHKYYHLQWKLFLHCASAGILAVSHFYTCFPYLVTTSWIKWTLPTSSTIVSTPHVLTFPCNIIITKSSGKSKHIVHLFPSGAQKQCLIWRFLLLSNWALQMF